jgi:signal transduction histidine kinase
MGYFLIQSVIREISMRAALELAYVELKKLDDAKSEFIAIASHQLRSPLTAVKGYVSMILEKSYGEVPGEMSQPLKNVYASNERLINLVNDILNISKIEAGKMEMELENTSLEELILDIMNELKVKADVRKLYLKYEKPKTSIPDVMVDKIKMRQVIMNLIDNSIKYTEKGGTTIKLQIVDSRLQIIISDTGMGIDKEYIGQLFESFSRANVGARTHPEGTGLGLYIARRFVEMHKGRVWAESEGKGKGSKFFIEIPVK